MGAHGLGPKEGTRGLSWSLWGLIGLLFPETCRFPYYYHCCMRFISMAGIGLDRDRRTSLDSCEPRGLTAILGELWPRVPLDHTGPRWFPPFRNEPVSAFLAFPSYESTPFLWISLY
ncbi:hypothetical protein CRG98_003125 [Punica granatum]|uniref:Uncharacterized protein n=1 Tax=Punica granatum TaxID=22663 RepID=A0A2I0L8M5_PUNGR|nr:hypothetical protein CRG98_003125 [Punica granatum]